MKSLDLGVFIATWGVLGRCLGNQGAEKPYLKIRKNETKGRLNEGGRSEERKTEEGKQRQK